MRIGTLKQLAGAALAAAVVAFAATPADAAFKLSIDTNGVVGSGAAVQVTDNQTGDLNALPGVIVWSGSLNTFTVLVSVGQSKPAIGDAANSIIDSNFTATGVGTVTFALTDTGFTALGNGGGSTDIGGTAAGTLNALAYFDGTNAEFGKGTLISALGPFTGGGAFAAKGSTSGLSGTPFSLTSIVTITHLPGLFNTTTGDHNIRVPEPALLALFGLGLLGVARRRRG